MNYKTLLYIETFNEHKILHTFTSARFDIAQKVVKLSQGEFRLLRVRKVGKTIKTSIFIELQPC